MPMPMIKSCGCLSLRTGCLILCFISTLACVANITAGSWNLPRHREREPEDNLISLSMVMFSTLSGIANLTGIFGILLKRPNKLQLSLLSNCVFILCIFLVAVVTCIFRLGHILKDPANMALVFFMLLAGAAYSIFYLIVVNSLYKTMKMTFGESPIPI